MPDADESESLLAYVGFGGVAACCLGIELLGGAAILGGLATTIGLSTGVTYLVVAGIGGLLAAGLTLGYRQFGDASHV
jgi:hypothetical protein